MYTTTQTIKPTQIIKALYAQVEGKKVEILDLRSVQDTDNYYMVADVRFSGALLPVSVPVSKLCNIYAMVEQVMQ